ncbi:toprim domain-containing protein [Arsenophonus sp. PmNCSU2021_1]|uniref:toprim domain-containing protein n=1 Tax=Arsenophonus sp. PmNCSU2021_1 TaxID=3118989 RepID=UPI002FF40F7D
MAALKTAVGANKKPLLVWALDKGNAGEKAIRKHVARSQQEGCKSWAALPSQFKNEDWNDLHNDTHRNDFYFQFDSRFYWFKLDIERHLKAVERILDSEKLTKEEATTKALKESGAVNEIANCYPTPLHFQKSEETDESWYYLKLDFPQQRPNVKATFTASQLTSASEFKKRLLHVAKGAVYTGDTHQLDRFCKNELPHIKEVKTQNFIGYNKALGVYVFNDIAVQNGKLYTLNEEDYFSLEHVDIKTLSNLSSG